MVGALEETGAIGEVADGVEDLTGGDRTAELLGITWIAAAGSAVVDNIPFTTAMIPVVEQLGGAEEDAYWWALSLGACFGGNATIIAAAANVAAAGLTERAGRPIGFVAFLKVGIPVTVLSVAMASLYITVRYIMLIRADAGRDRESNDPRDRAAASVRQRRRGRRPHHREDLPALPGGGREGRVRGDLRRARVHGRRSSPATSANWPPPGWSRATSTR